MKTLFSLLFFIGLANAQESDVTSVSFFKADSVATIYKNASLENLPVLTHNLTSPLDTDIEKFRAIYTWISTNIESDYSSYLKTSRKRKKLSTNRDALLAWNTDYTPTVFKNMVKHKRTACTGFAYLVREMANLAGFECKIINGYGRTPTLQLTENSLPNHSWNAVKLNEKWYLCDATWSAGEVTFEDGAPTFKFEYADGYFLAEPNLFATNHYPLEKEWLLQENPIEFKTFIDGPVVYKGAFNINSYPVAPLKMQLETVKNTTLAFDLKTKQTKNKTEFKLMLSSGNTTTVLPEIMKTHDGYQLTYTFTKTGLFDVHLLQNDVMLATYVVRVKRK